MQIAKTCMKWDPRKLISRLIKYENETIAVNYEIVLQRWFHQGHGLIKIT